MFLDLFLEHPTFESFCKQYDSERICAEALFRSRWPEGFRCPACCHSHFYLIRTRRLPLYECKSCSHQTSIITGTIMEGSRTSLIRWFRAMFLLSQPEGISSSRLSKVIQVTYKTAWLMSHKIRHAMQMSENNEPLTGAIQLHPTYYGYTYYRDARQPLLIGGSLNEQDELTQVKIKQPDPAHINNEFRRIEKTGIQAFIKMHTDERDATIFGYGGKFPLAFSRIKKKVSGWLNATFYGIGAKHLQAYLDEFCFRLNLNYRHTPVFSQLLHRCAATPPLIYRNLIRNKPVLAVPWKVSYYKARWKGEHLSRWSSGW